MNQSKIEVKEPIITWKKMSMNSQSPPKIPNYDFKNKRKSPYILNISAHGEYILHKDGTHDIIDMVEYPYITRLLKINLTRPYINNQGLINNKELIEQLHEIDEDLTFENVGKVNEEFKRKVSFFQGEFDRYLAQ